MSAPPAALRSACLDIEALVERRRAARIAPLLVALDGASGSGKSTLAALLTDALDAAWVPGDDFYAAHVPDAEWARCSAAEKVDRCIDWRRLRTEALEPLRAGRPARWLRLDFDRGPRPDGTYARHPDPCIRQPRPTVLVEGAYSARPELADLIDVTILVDAPLETRHTRLAAREEAKFLEAWHTRWDEAELHYFTTIRPPSAFDLVVRNP